MMQPNLFVNIFIFTGACYVLLIVWLLKGWLQLRTFKPPSNQCSTKVSIILPARNEENNISQCLEAIAQQKFPVDLLEVIVVNDHSTDGTVEKIQLFISSGTNLKIQVIDLQEDDLRNAYKKRAIAKGIAIASGELIITTDADCWMHEKWLHTMVSYYETYRPAFISAPVAFGREKNWFGKFQTLEFLGLIGIGAGSIRNGVPTMCNGANLAYQRKVFFDVGGFEGVSNLASGDDTFLMLKINDAFKKGVHFLKSPEAIVYTEPKETVNDFMEQRKRWASKGTRYNSPEVIAIGALTYLFNVLLFSAMVISVFYNIFTVWMVTIMAGKLAVEIIFLYCITSFFRRKNLLFYFLPEQLLYVLYVVYVGAAGAISTYTWKGRVVK